MVTTSRPVRSDGHTPVGDCPRLIGEGGSGELLRAMRSARLDADLSAIVARIERRRRARAVVHSWSPFMLALITALIWTHILAYAWGALAMADAAESAYQRERDAWADRDATLYQLERAVDLLRDTDARLLTRSFLFPVEVQP